MLVNAGASVKSLMNIIENSSRRLAFLLILLSFSTVFAQQGFQVGVQAYPVDGVAGATVTMPMFTTEDVQHSARAAVSYAFTGLPALSVSYMLSDTTTDAYYTYIGAGVGLAFPAASAVSPSFSGHVLAGVNVEITQSFGAFTEVTVAGNNFGTRLGLGVGVTYAFGGSN